MRTFGFIHLLRIFVAAIFLTGGLAAYGASGDVDTTFNASAQYATNSSVFTEVTQTDGKTLIGGVFTVINGYAAGGIARLNVDGSVDTSFNPPDFYNGSGNGATIYTIAVQTDGKILVGGYILGAGDYKPGIRRLNPDGSIDPSFFIQELNPSFELTTVFDIKIRTDGKIMVGGAFGFVTPETRRNLMRLNADGTLDTSFTQPSINGVNIKEMALFPDGRILVGGLYNAGSPPTGPYLNKLNPDGSFDPTFNPTASGNGTVEAVKVLSNGQILIGGSFSNFNGFQLGRIAKINSDGSIDLTFNQNFPGADGTINDIAVETNGKILIGGAFTLYNGVSKPKLAQLNADGTPDGSFTANLGNIVAVETLKLLPGGSILAGYSGSVNQTGGAARLNSDGSTDTSIRYSVGRGAIVYKILHQSDGKIIVGGSFSIADNVPRPGLARFNTDGSLDTGFNPPVGNPQVTALAIRTDGKILVGYQGGNFILVLNTDGSLSGGYDPGTGPTYDIAVLANGQILAAGGYAGNKYLIRFNSNGTVDSTFGVNQPSSYVRKIFVQPDNKILIGGEFSQIGATIRQHFARLNSDGSVDAAFNPPGGTNGNIYDIDLQSDGKIVLVGSFTSLNGSSTRRNVGRVDSSGNTDPNFTQSTDGELFGVKIQPNGKILVSGSMAYIGGGVAFKPGMARFNTDGSVDNSFTAIANSTVYDVDLQSDGKVVAGGLFTRVNRVSSPGAVRLLNNTLPPKTLFDFDGDGKADVSVFRPSTNRWYEFLSSTSTVSEFTFGLSGDVVAPADYDGDGKTDLAIFRPSAGDWWYLSSINNAQINVHWGQAGDVPRPSDFDGDGKSDFIVYRPSNNVWYRFGSTGAVSITAFGAAGDKPLTGDFDGDGKSDLAIFRPSTGDWWYLASSNGSQRAVHWGSSNDVPAPADFDGDGKTDFAVFRPSEGGWYILNSSNGSFVTTAFGLSNDKPVPADYDGDGKADIAVFRPSTGIWYLLQSTAGFSALQFGISTDIPTPNAFVP